MINKTLKNLFNNNNVNFNLYIFKLKNKFLIIYLVLFVVLTACIYLTGPKFIDYKKYEQSIRELIRKNYGISIENSLKISYNIFPSPRINFFETEFKTSNDALIGKKGEFSLLLNLNNIYDYKKIKIKKLIIKKTNIDIKTDKINNLFDHVSKIKNLIIIENSFLNFKDDKKKLIVFEKFNLRNNKSGNIYFEGLLFKEKIFIDIIKNKNFIKLKAPSYGSYVDLKFNNIDKFKKFDGELQATILKNKIKFNFKKNDILIISKSFFRNELLSFSFNGDFNLDPSFFLNLNIILQDNNFKKLNIEYKKKKHKIYEYLKINKKINGNISIQIPEIKSKIINQADFDIQLENGTIHLKKSFLKFNGGNLYVRGYADFFADLKLFNFILDLNIDEKKIFLKQFKADTKNNEIVKVQTSGKLNFFANKIYFDSFYINKKKKKDTRELKNHIENLVIKNGVDGLFDFNKIADLINKLK